MECQSYFPVYNSNYELNLDANGSAKPTHYGNGTFQSGHYSKYMFPLPVPQGPLELFRQTILMHEVTFRDQVQELHRVYRRQKELMSEIRSEQLYTNYFNFEGQSPDSSAKYSTSDGVRNTPHSLPFVNLHFKPFSLGNGNTETLPHSLEDHRISSSALIMCQRNVNCNNLHIPESKVRKIGGKFLDLELPAEFYNDCEEESLEDAKFPEPQMPSAPVALNLLANQVYYANSEVCQGSSWRNRPFSFEKNGYIDLNSDVIVNTEFTPSSITAKASPEVVLSCETATRSEKCRLIDINLPCESASEEEPVIEDHLDEGSLPKSSSSKRVALEIDLEAPPSPEVEERPPPRGDSEENLLETGQVSTSELVKIAAEAIVSISSSSKTQPFTDLQKCVTSESGTLEWFAGLIHSISYKLEKENDFTDKLDEFEAMTLELTEMKEEEYWSKSGNPQILENLSSSIPAGINPMRKGRTRRSKKKDFQREVLPSLSSLSKYEVTEDIQIIEALMEAAGTPCNLTRGRRACRMGRKPRAAAKKPVSELLPEVHVGALTSWGRANRRPRGERSRASPSMVLTRWLEFST